jgi:hypothetical protein
MIHDPLKIGEETATEIENWFSKTYSESGKSQEDVQLLILYKLHQLEERLKAVEGQTKTHWAN